ncbi:MAG TPA: MFS transporter [Pseudolysinimonas sp.]|jgi:MFS family permease|nr:MFS transporter [Pseudolysinimonas sp.]
MSSAAPPAPPAYAAAWRNAIFVVFTLNGFGAAAWISRVPSIRDHLQLSVTQVGLLILGVSVGAIVGMLLSSHVVHWLGERRVILLFLLGCGLSLMVVGLGATVLSSFAVTIAGFGLYGLTSGICDVGMNVSGAGSERANRRNIMPWFHASWSFGTVAGSALGAAAAFAGVDVAVHLAVIGALQIAGAVLVIRWIPTDATLAQEHGDPTPVTFAERMSIWLNPRTLLIGLLVLGMAFTEGSANDWIAIGFIDDRGFDNGQGALMFGVFTLAMTAGRLAGVPLLDRFGRVPVLRGAALAAAVGLAIVILVPVIPIAIFGVVLWGLGASLGFPVGMSAAADDPRTAAASVSAVATVGYAAFLIGPPLIGFVGDHIGVLNALWIVLGLIVIATLAIPAAREPEKRAARAAALADSQARADTR